MMALKKNVERIRILLEIMSYRSKLPCFEKFDIQVFVDRFKPDYNAEQTLEYVESLVAESLYNKRTIWYDDF